MISLQKNTKFWLALITIIIATSIYFHQKNNSPTSEIYYQLESNVFNGAEIKDALSKLDKAYKNNPNDPWVYLSASLATLIEGYTIGDWYDQNTFEEGTSEKALSLAEKAVQLGPKISQTHAHLARILILRNEYKMAWNELNIAYQLDPNNFYAWYFKGIIAEKMADTKKAREYFIEAEKKSISQHHYELTNSHRQEIAKLDNNKEEQEELLKLNIKNNPKKSHLYGNYAVFLMVNKRYDEAVTYWEKAIEIAPYPEAEKQLIESKRLRSSEAK